MMKIIKCTHLLSIIIIVLFTSAFADEVITKKVYSFKTEDGTPVFTDKKPHNNKTYETRTIEIANSIPSADNREYGHTPQPTNNINITHTQKIIIEREVRQRKKSIKKKSSTSRCQSYKEKLEFYAEKMREGYTSSEYKKLEKNRKKYRKLLFNRCETKTFND